MGDSFRGGFRREWEGLLPEGLMGGVRGEQGSGVNWKTVQAQNTNSNSQEPLLGKRLIGGTPHHRSLWPDPTHTPSRRRHWFLIRPL